MRVRVLLLPARVLSGLSMRARDVVPCLGVAGTHFLPRPCAWLRCTKGLCGHAVQGNRLDLWCWAGWSCRRKPRQNCLKRGQVIHFCARCATRAKNIATTPKNALLLRGAVENFFPSSDRKTKCMGRSQPRGVIWASRSLKGCTQLRSRFFDVQSSLGS